MVGTVLIVDADQGFTQPAQTALEAQGVTVHVREDAPIDFVRKLRPTVMMLNVELPSSTGFSICSRIRRDRELKQTPILLTSSEASAEALKKHAASSDRADDYARKPVALDDLVARISKLLANSPVPPQEARSVDIPAPTPSKETPAAGAKNGAAPSEQAIVAEPDDDLVAQLRMELDQPSARPADGSVKAEPSAKPPAPPPTEDMPRQAPKPSVSVDLPGPPPLRKEPPPSPPPATPEELWRPIRLEEALKGALEIGEPQAPQKATPEERLAFFRQLVKFYESKDRVFRDVWNTTQQQGTDLARRAGALGVDLQNKERRLAEVLQDRDQVHRRLQAVETELKTFQDEITRIFREKDVEEQATVARMSALEQANAALTKELQAARAQNRDDEHRLNIFQEEVGELHEQKDQAEARIIELDRALDDAGRGNEELRARLSMTEDVAAERADEIEHLKEALDSLKIESDQSRQRIEKGHEDALAAAEAEADAEIEALKKEHAQQLQTSADERAEAIARLSSRHEEILATLSRTHESEVVAIEEERDHAQKRTNELVTEVRVLEQKLRNAANERAAEAGALRADIEGLERGNQDLTEQLDLTATALESVTSDRNQLATRLESTESELTAVRHQAEEIAAMLDDERVASANHAEELEKIIETERNESQARISSLEEQVDAAQNEAFEQLAAYEKLRKAHENLRTKSHEIESTLKITEKALNASESRVKSLEHDLGQLRDEHTSFKAQTDRRIRTESEELRKERALRAALELEVESFREELTGKDERIARAESERAEMKTREAEALAKLESNRREVQQIQSRFGSLNQELETLRRAKQELEASERGGHAHIESLERDLKALEATEEALLREIDARDEQIQELEAVAEAERASAKTIEAELGAERAKNAGLSKLHEELKGRHEEMMRRIVRTLGAAHEVLNREIPKDETGKDIPEYVGEIEPIEPASDEIEALVAEARPDHAEVESPWHVPRTDTGTDDPFVALVAQLEREAAEAEEAQEDPAGKTAVRGRPFEESFAHESTTTDGPSVFASLTGPVGQRPAHKNDGVRASPGVKKGKGPPVPPPRSDSDSDDEGTEADRNVTEIIQLDDLK